jgi:hypothetical protein
MRDLRLYSMARRWHQHEEVTEYWFPAYGHPDGRSDVAWFRVVDGWGYQTSDCPAGASDFPCFRVLDGWTYPTLGLPGASATFQVLGSFAYAGSSGGPWFHIKQRVV